MAYHIDIFGDSIMKGIVLDAQAGRYRPMNSGNADRFGRLFGAQVNNCSHFGYTIRKGEALLSRMLARGVKGDYALLEYGGNDCDFDWKAVAADPEGEHLPNTPLAEFTARYTALIGRLRQNGVTPVLMTLPPIDAERYLGWVAPEPEARKRVVRWLGDVQLIYRFQELYSGAVARIAAQTGALLADVRPCFLDKHNYRSLLCEDGIHPNEAGHQLIFDALCRFARGVLGGGAEPLHA